ncbi:hypothetical protein JZ751_025300 [Albula glossodonta]|uniref:SP100 nuclear antigen n=1 Tax=Albula glossodonta TaxID=121402 RepID=A0A8T2NHU3_9TELE|nr:hypothetical protein JZ751_025300 [Albula glossodonta]
MEPRSLDIRTDDELLWFFRNKKTEISCINQPYIFLSQLRDYDLVQEDVYKKVNRMKSQQQRERMLYQILDRLETDQPHRIRTFWNCVLKPHILQHYPELSSLRDSLMEGQNGEMERESMVANTRANSRARREETVEESQPCSSTQHTPCQRRSQTRSQSSRESTSATLINPGSSIKEGGMREIQPGPSTQRTPVQRRPQRRPHAESNRSPSQNVESDMFWKKTLLPVNCGNAEGILDRDRLAKGQDCILIEGNWVSPSKFEKCGGKASSRKWKESIRCKNIPLQQLIQEGHLEYSAQKRRSCPSRDQTMDSYSGEESDTESMDERESNDDVVVSAFEDNCLSVTCGSASGTLHKDRFARGSSIKEGGMREIQPGPSTQCTPVQRRPQRRPHAESNRSPSQNVESDAFWKKRFLPVNCGNEEGILDRDRLAKGQDCILIEGNWLSPSKFEKCGGRASSKKWKESIRCKNITLQQLIQEGHLEYSAQRRRSCPSRDQTMDSYSEEESDAESMDERESNDDVGMSASEDNCLSVTCGSASGTLHKDRFAREDRGRCIQTGNKWLTPEDFRKESTPVNFRSVKNIIMCQGVSLRSLIEIEVNWCAVTSAPGPSTPPATCLNKEIWVCTYCLLKEQSMATGHMSLSQAQDCCISDYMLHCQYLLMNVYKADKQHSIAAVFSTNPCNIKDYEKVIKRPMWLNKIAENLQFEKYSSVGQFASDVKLIFDNCSIFNKGKEIEKKGDQLYTLFKNEFKKLFNIQE